MVRDDAPRTLLHELDNTVQALSAKLGQGDASVVRLAATYNNLLGMWVDT